MPHEEEYMARQRLKIVEFASQILSGQIGLLLGVRMLLPLEELLANSEGEDYEYLNAIWSESDGLPLGSSRKYWDADALKKQDARIERFEGSIRNDILDICRRFIAKYSEEPENETGEQ